MRRLRLLHLCGTAGSSPYFEAWADFTDRERFQVTFASLTSEGVMQRDLRARGASVLAFDCESRADRARLIPRLAAWLRKERVDILQTHLFDAALVGGLAARLAGTRLVVFTGHHSHEAALPGNWRFRLADSLLSGHLSHRIIAHSRDMRDIFVRHEGVAPERIAVIPYPFDFRRWQPGQEGRARVRAELALGDAVGRGAVGRLFWVKDYPSLFKAFASLPERHGHVRLVVVGEGSQRRELEDLRDRLGLGPRVVLAGQRSDMVDVFSAFDLFVHASLAESFCQALVEACAMGRPVISTAVGIAPEVIDSGSTGELVAPGDTAALGQAMLRMLERRQQWPEMAAACRERVGPFSAETIIPRYEGQLLSWLERP